MFATARAEGNLKPKQQLALAANRHLKNLESSLADERSERKRLQSKLDEIGPRCKSLEAISEFDSGITTWAAIVVAIGNAILAIAGFHDAEPGKEIFLVAGLILSIGGTLFIIGLHKLWMPRALKESKHNDQKPT
jgi:hypothetical protein